MPVERVRSKSPDDIRRQAVSNSEYVREVIGVPLIPPSFSGLDSLGRMAAVGAKQIFGTKRWDIFTTVLRCELAGRDIPEDQQWEMGRTLRLLNNVDQYIADHHANPDGQVLYPRQMEVFEALANYLKNGGMEGYFKLPTAFGKTVVFSEFAKAADVKTLVVVPTIELIDQTEDKFGQFSSPTQVGKVYAESRNFGEKVTVITYQSLVRWIEERVPPEEAVNFRPYDYELVILDEAHRALGESTSEALAAFPDSVKLGFTATPFYDKERNLEKLLGTMIYGMTIKEAVEESLLSDFKVWVARTNTDLSGVGVNPQTGDYNRIQLARAIDIPERNKAAADLYNTHFDGQSAIVTSATIAHAIHIAEEFRKNGIAAEAIYGNLGQKKRTELLDKYKSGEIKVLVSSKLLDEGVDLPKASVLINLRPTCSPVVAEQRGGRVLRIDTSNPFKDATIVDFIDIQPTYGLPVTFAEVAGSARIRNPRRINIHRPEDQKTKTRTLVVQEITTVPGLIITTNVEEIMRIVSAASKERESRRDSEPQKIGEYERIFSGDLIEEFGVHPSAYNGAFRRVSEVHEGEFKRLGSGRPSYATKKGHDLLRKELELSASKTGYKPFTKTLLIEKYNTDEATVAQAVILLEREVPGLIIRRGRGRSSLIDSKRSNLLDEKIEKIKIPETMTRVDTRKLARDIGMNEHAALYRIEIIMQANPHHFFKREGGIIRAADPEGYMLLAKGLAESKIPEGYRQIPVGELRKRYKLTPKVFQRTAEVLQETDPVNFLNIPYRKGVFVNDEGLAKLEKAIQERPDRQPGFSRISTEKLAEQYGIAQSSVTRKIKNLQDQYPEEFRLNKRISSATSEGMKVLEEELQRIQARQQKAQDYPEIPINEGSISFTTPSESLSITVKTPFRLPDASISIAPSSTIYGSELWKLRVARYFVVQRSQSDITLEQLAARMDCDIKVIEGLEAGQAPLEEFQGDLPRRWHEAIGKTDMYPLFNLMFHEEHGVILPEAA